MNDNEKLILYAKLWMSGNELSMKGAYKQAIEKYSKAIKLFPNKAGTYYSRGVLRLKTKDIEGAIKDFSTTIRMDPDDSCAYFARGNCFLETERYNLAIEDYNRALTLNKPGMGVESESILNNKSIAESRLGLEGPKKRKKEDRREILMYCIYCGQDRKDGHFVNCPIVQGVPKMLFGIRPKADDPEYNLALGRKSLLTTRWTDPTGRVRVGPPDPEINHRLVYEEIAFMFRRMVPQHWYHSSKKDSLLGFYHKMKLKENEKDFEGLKKSAKDLGLSPSEFDELVASEKILLRDTTGKLSVPVFRNPKTKELVYLPVE